MQLRMLHNFRLVVFIAFAGILLSADAMSNGGDDHSAGNAAANPATSVSITTSERNIQNDSGQFTIVLKRSPGDPRVGEIEHVLISLAEKVEGGFGAGTQPIENAAVTFSVTRPDGTAVAENLTLRHETGGFYRGSYKFSETGDFKFLFNVTTSDKRTFVVDFPVLAARAPVRVGFWIGFLVLLVVSGGALTAVIYKLKRRGPVGFRQTAPVAAVVLAIFILSTVALAFLLPPSQTRETAEISVDSFSTASVNKLAAASQIIVSKESQLLFGIKTQPVEIRSIISGLKTTGEVRVRPDQKGIVTAQVSGRIVLSPSISLGAAVSRGQQIGTIEQVLDVSGQVDLESQRLDVEAQHREVEAKKLELRNTILSLQSQQAQLRASAQQARIRLVQARRELQRARNLVDVGASPAKRVEEAQTEVNVIEDEVSSADSQIGLIGNQIREAQNGQAIFRSVSVRQPVRNFPLISPITGIVDQIKAASGQQIASGAELIDIVNLSTVLIEAKVFEKDIPVVRESTRASFTSSALPGETYTIGNGDGRLVSIGQTVNELTRTVPVIFEVKNPFGRLRDGNFVDITIDTSEKKKVLAILKAAVVQEQGETFVFVFDGGETFERRLVVLGAEGSEYVEILSGVEEGERVVVEGVYQLRTTQATE